MFGIGTAYSQFDSSMRHHAIIAVDMTMPGQSWQQSDNTFQTIFNNLLSDSIFREGDLLSIVGFSTDELATDLDDYTYTLKNHLIGNLGHLRFSTSLRDSLREQWSTIASQGNRLHQGYHPFSMISLAKMYAFASVKQQDCSHYVNRTFLVFISDQRYNGGDFYQEAMSLYDFNYRLTPNMMQDYGQRVASKYFVKHICGNEMGYHQHIDLFEYIPLQDGLTLPTVIDFSSGSIMAQRTRLGHYRLYLTATNRHDQRYRLLQLRYRIVDKDGNMLLDTLCRAGVSGDDYAELDSFNIVYDIGIRRRASSVKIDAWVSLRDGIYDATVLTPVKNAPTYLASRGLGVIVPIQYEKKALILGVVPLPGLLQFSDNQISCAAVVSLLVALLLFLALIMLVRRIRVYHPKTEDISIELNRSIYNTKKVHHED
jgi:hypothetical protein